MSKQIITWNNHPVTFNGIPLMSEMIIPLVLNIKYVDIWLNEVYYPVDNVFVEIRSGSPTGTVLGTSNSLNGATIAQTFTQERFTFSTPVTLNSGTQYYLRANRSSGNDSTNYYNVAVNISNIYSNGNFGQNTSPQSTNDLALILTNSDNNEILNIPFGAGFGTIGFDATSYTYIWQSFKF